MHTFSTLPVELVYRIMDHQDELTLFCSMQNISRRLNQILSTYERYRWDSNAIPFPGIRSDFVRWSDPADAAAGWFGGG
ncbi:unnamed protein product [Adineta ricciae]|uniref:F-box domain-containing protein n=1 Tax=Adineta ricciae TaxID=249248 RepID=A0A815PGT4_ADIRI|nr:unnamed protein product [Adineta ricciae]